MCGRILKSGPILARTATRPSPGLTTWRSKSLLVYPVEKPLMKRYRHRRIHEAQQDGQLLNEEDLDNEDNDSVSHDEEEPPESLHHAVPGVSAVTSMPSMPSSIPLQSTMGTMMTPHMIAPQLLQQHL